jgi:hypothetical protein
MVKSRSRSQQPTTVSRGLQIGSSHVGFICDDISSADRPRPACYCQPVVVKVNQRSLSNCCIEQRCAARGPGKLQNLVRDVSSTAKNLRVKPGLPVPVNFLPDPIRPHPTRPVKWLTRPDAYPRVRVGSGLPAGPGRPANLY